MASCYNGRPLPAEVFVAGGRIVDVLTADDVSRWAATRLGSASKAPGA
jgi:hypothetical protein